MTLLRRSSAEGDAGAASRDAEGLGPTRRRQRPVRALSGLVDELSAARAAGTFRARSENSRAAAPGDMSSLIDVLRKTPDARFGHDPEFARDAMTTRSTLGDGLAQDAKPARRRSRALGVGRAAPDAFRSCAGFDRSDAFPPATPPIPMGGDATNPVHDGVSRRATIAIVIGASVRLVMDVGDWDNSRCINAPGQSGDPRSPHYADLAPLWAKGEYVPLLYSREAVDAATETLITLHSEVAFVPPPLRGRARVRGRRTCEIRDPPPPPFPARPEMDCFASLAMTETTNKRGNPMARIPYFDIDQAQGRAKKAYEKLPRLNIFRMLGHSGELVDGFNRMGSQLLYFTKLDPILREIAIIRVGVLSKATYEVSPARAHRPRARHERGDDRRHSRRAGGRRLLGDRESRSCATPTTWSSTCAPSDATFAPLARHLSHQEMQELTLAIGFYMMVSRFLETFDVDIESEAVGLNRVPGKA